VNRKRETSQVPPEQHKHCVVCWGQVKQTQIVGIQMRPSGPPGTVELPGLRESLHGWFTVNLGVYIPEVALYHGGGEAKSWIQDYHCAIRTRLGCVQ
jgi:hypothetical protein